MPTQSPLSSPGLANRTPPDVTDDFSRCMALLDELEQSSLAKLVLPALTVQHRSLLLGRLIALYATVAAEAGTSVALELGERELQVASRWFG